MLKVSSEKIIYKIRQSILPSIIAIIAFSFPLLFAPSEQPEQVKAQASKVMAAQKPKMKKKHHVDWDKYLNPKRWTEPERIEKQTLVATHESWDEAETTAALVN